MRRGLFALLILGVSISTTLAEDVPNFRGTERPLERDSNAWQWVGRALLLPPWLAMEATSWPAEQVFVAYDRHPRFRTLVDLFATGVVVGPVRLEAIANYESGDIAPEAGLKATRHDFLGDGGLLTLKGAYLSDDFNTADLRWSTPEHWARLHVRAIEKARLEREFFGFGPGSDDEFFEVDRRRSLLEATLDLRHGATRLSMTGYRRWIRLNSFQREDSDALYEAFVTARRSDYAGAELALALDTRDHGPASTRGVFVEGSAGIDRAQSCFDSDYEHYALEVQGFVPLTRDKRTLLVRGFAGKVDPVDVTGLPYVEMEQAGGRTGPRGYRRERFTDLAQLVLTAEYRYRVSGPITGSLFVDWGTVAEDLESLRLSATTPSLGLGVLFGPEKTAALQVAVSEEGVQFSVGGDGMLTRLSRRLR